MLNVESSISWSKNCVNLFVYARSCVKQAVKGFYD